MLLVVLAAIAIVLYLVFDIPAKLENARSWIRDLGAIGPFILIGVYAIGAVFLLPGSILTLAAGAIYGVMLGYVYAAIASVLGATLAFLVGRTIGRRWVESRLDGNPRFAAIDTAVKSRGWRIVLLTRLSPVLPFNLQNYMYGITGIRLREYVLASWIGMLPGTLLYVYLGSAAAGGAQGDLAKKIMFGVGLVATIIVTIYVTRAAREALEETIDEETIDEETGDEETGDKETKNENATDKNVRGAETKNENESEEDDA